MGKNDFLSPKAIANRIKAKGLQKLRWYCQMCQKQCRDENGFKCHLTSESHKRQMMVFGQAPMRVVDGYSEEFENTFLDQLRQSHGSSRVSAKVVYNEFINDRNHIHMNSTKWLTLTEFVKYLGREGKCRVDETPKGWFISLIQKDPMEQLSDERRIKRSRAEKEEDDRQREALEAQIERAQAAAVDHSEEPAAAAAAAAAGRELVRGDDDQPLRMSLATAPRGSAPQAHQGPIAALPDESQQGVAEPDPKRARAERPKSKLEELMERDKAQKAQLATHFAVENGMAHRHDVQQQNGRSDRSWLHKGLVVKVMSKELPDYYKKKAVVDAIVTEYAAEVSMQDSGDVLRIDQAQLETVLPSAGGAILVLAGPYAHMRGTMLGVNTSKYQAQVALKDGKELWLDYEEVCKLQA